MTDVIELQLGTESYGYSIVIDGGLPVKKVYNIAGRSKEECCRQAFMAAIPAYRAGVQGGDGREVIIVFPNKTAFNGFTKTGNAKWDRAHEELRTLNAVPNPVFRATRVGPAIIDKDLTGYKEKPVLVSMADIVAMEENK